jgi:hypothetical protein
MLRHFISHIDSKGSGAGVTVHTLKILCHWDDSLSPAANSTDKPLGDIQKGQQMTW